MDGHLQIDMDEFLPLRDVVFNTLRRAILKGQLKPGERLMEVHLANRLGVSRTPIREAIRKLELEGLVIMIPRRGAEVARITEKSLKDVLEVRRALDVLSVELACQRIDENGIKELWTAYQEFKKAAQGKDAAVIAQADVAFHDIIVEAVGNLRLQQLVNNLSEQMFRNQIIVLFRMRFVFQLQPVHPPRPPDTSFSPFQCQSMSSISTSAFMSLSAIDLMMLRKSSAV